jgi:hypothetical protein
VSYLKEIYIRHPVYTEVVPVHLSMGLRGGIRSSEVRKFMDELHQCGQYHDIVKAVSSCIVDLNLAMTDLNDAQMHTMAENFDELVMFDELVKVTCVKEKFATPQNGMGKDKGKRAWEIAG